VGHQRA